jgi:hypothetical protein
MIDLHSRICRLDSENFRLRKRLTEAIALVDSFTQRYVDRWSEDDAEHLVIHDRAYYEGAFLSDLLNILENDR